jgi:hypothetical protein
LCKQSNTDDHSPNQSEIQPRMSLFTVSTPPALAGSIQQERRSSDQSEIQLKMNLLTISIPSALSVSIQQIPTGAQSFTLFAYLPAELQLKIWSYSLRRRVVGIRSENLRLNRFLTSIGIPTSLERRPFIGRYQSKSEHPSLVHTCHDARTVALKHYETSSFGYHLSNPVFFDFKYDTLMVHGYTDLRFLGRSGSSSLRRVRYLAVTCLYDHRVGLARRISQCTEIGIRLQNASVRFDRVEKLFIVKEPSTLPPPPVHACDMIRPTRFSELQPECHIERAYRAQCTMEDFYRELLRHTRQYIRGLYVNGIPLLVRSRLVEIVVCTMEELKEMMA